MKLIKRYSKGISILLARLKAMYAERSRDLIKSCHLKSFSTALEATITLFSGIYPKTPIFLNQTHVI